MSISFYKAGHHAPSRAHAIGFSIAYGYFPVDEIDETRKQLNFSIGFWWWIFQWQLWREK